MDKCCGPVEVKSNKFKRIVWVALVLNLSMFFYEFAASFLADSQSLKADSLDFLGDAANYGVSLFVIGMALHTRAKASLLKGFTMGAFGVWILGLTIYSAFNGTRPVPEAMGLVGTIALLVNGLVAFLLYQYRDGDSNMQSVWLCTRNDVIGNLAVLAAAVGVAYWNSMIPDLIVAAFMAYLSVTASLKIIRLALVELKSPVPVETCASKRVR